MKLHVVALSALVFAPFMPASAQVTTSPGDAGKRFYDWGMKRPDGTTAECACVAGFYAGATEDDAFRLVARMVEQINADFGFDNEEAAFAALREKATGQAISNERLAEIIASFETFDLLGQKADTVCVPLKPRTQTPAVE